MTAQILVVDDQPDMKALVLQKFRQQIRDGAINFVFASDGVEALAMLETNVDIHMVVADINMPRMDGLALLQKLRESAENLSTIIVSAYGDMSNILRGRTEALRAFEPLRREQYENPATKSYLEAFAKLEAGDPGAMAAFAAHVGKHADDQLASFHLKRLLNGATGTRIVMD